MFRPLLTTEVIGILGREDPTLTASKIQKLSYLIDRQYLKETGYPLICEMFYMTDDGPLCITMRDMLANIPSNKSFMRSHITISDAGIEVSPYLKPAYISRHIEKIVDKTHSIFRLYSDKGLLEYIMRLPECKSLKIGSPIHYESIFQSFLFNEERIHENLLQILSHEYIKSLFGGTE